MSSSTPHLLLPSTSQREAIEAPPQAQLVMAGPGAGKTFCLIERIQFLIDSLDFDPARICAFTFTNKAAGEISARLESRLGAARAERVKRGTIHSFCAELLRESGECVGVQKGFGIADDKYQLSVLARLEGKRRWHRNKLTQFSAYRLRGGALRHDDHALFQRYQKFLHKRNVLDFDSLVIKAVELLNNEDAGRALRSRWDVVLVDEFQDLNPLQYGLICRLALDHRHVFAVGDDDQSIYSWAGADPTLFTRFSNEFNLSKASYLGENHRCPREVFAVAQRLVSVNPRQFENRTIAKAERDSGFNTRAVSFDGEESEEAWLVSDVQSDQATSGHRWGNVAILYRTHETGNRLETAFINAGIPCQLSHGRALADDPVVAYVIVAINVIMHPLDDLHQKAYLEKLLPQSLFDDATATADRMGQSVWRQLRQIADGLPRKDESARQIRRALADATNLRTIGSQHGTLSTLVIELLSRRVGKLNSALAEHSDDISDPAELEDVAALAARLEKARANEQIVWLESMGGMEIPIMRMLDETGIKARSVHASSPGDAVKVEREDIKSVCFPLGLFKALQLVETSGAPDSFADFCAVDLETTDRDTATAEIVEIAAVRVRNGEIVDRYHTLVKPTGPITPGATETHGYSDNDVADMPSFAAVWPVFREFCGNDIIVAHNGYAFDFPILKRMTAEIGEVFDVTMYDSLSLARDLITTSCKLVDLCRLFDVETGTSHHALDDTIALAKVLRALVKLRQSRLRKTSLSDLLGHLGVALALDNTSEHTDEDLLFRRITVPFALGQYSRALDFYEQESKGNEGVPTVDEVIESLGGSAVMMRIRKDKSAEDRYPQAIGRLRRLIGEIEGQTLNDQLSMFLERVALSQFDGQEPDDGRVHLATLHSTKGLEFSRVYIIGVEDAQMPGIPRNRNIEPGEIEEARRLLYVGMTRTVDRLVMTRVETRNSNPTGGHRFFDEMGLAVSSIPSTS